MISKIIDAANKSRVGLELAPAVLMPRSHDLQQAEIAELLRKCSSSREIP
jgi:hypothetical protein